MKKITLFLCACSTHFILSAQALKKVILEEYTYPDCGYCLKGVTGMEEVHKAHPNNVIYIANHGAPPMENPYARAINKAYISGYPSGTIDRYQFSSTAGDVDEPISQWISKVGTRLSVSAPLNVDIASTYNSSTRVVNATVTANFVAAVSGDMRISCILVEDSVTGSSSAGYYQKNYMGKGTVSQPCTAPDPTSPWYNYPCQINNFNHRHVSRANLSAPVGASWSAIEHWGTVGVIPASVTAGSIYSKTYSYTLPSTWKSNRIAIVAFVSYYSTNVGQRSILNANEVKLGSSTGTTTGINEHDNGNQLEVKQNTPNPFNEHTVIQFQLNNSDNVTVKVYDMYGKEVKTLFNNRLAPGEYVFHWTADDNRGNGVAGGVYFCAISTSSHSISKQMIFINQ